MTFPLHFFRGVLDFCPDERVRAQVELLAHQNGLLLPEVTDAARCFNDVAVSDFFGEAVHVLFWLTRTRCFAPPQKLVLLQWMHSLGVDVHRRHDGTNLSVLFAPQVTLPYLQWCFHVGVDFRQTLDGTTILVNVCCTPTFTEDLAAITEFLVLEVGMDPLIAGPHLDDVEGLDPCVPLMHLIGASNVPDHILEMLLGTANRNNPPRNADGQTFMDLAVERESQEAVDYFTRAGFTLTSE